jgi:hypothetical protein
MELMPFCLELDAGVEPSGAILRPQITIPARLFISF